MKNLSDCADISLTLENSKLMIAKNYNLVCLNITFFSEKSLFSSNVTDNLKFFKVMTIEKNSLEMLDLCLGKKNAL